MSLPTRSKSKSKSGGGSGSRALVVFEANAVSMGQPVPLNVCDPGSSGPIGSRRSPRLNPIHKEVESENVARKRRSVAPEKCLRRSPRLSGAGSGNAESDVAGSSAKKVKRQAANCGSRNLGAPQCLRRSPRFAALSPVAVAENGESKARRESVKRGSRNLDTECLRRFPRFSPMPVVPAENDKCKSDFAKVHVRHFTCFFVIFFNTYIFCIFV